MIKYNSNKNTKKKTIKRKLMGLMLVAGIICYLGISIRAVSGMFEFFSLPEDAYYNLTGTEPSLESMTSNKTASTAGGGYTFGMIDYDANLAVGSPLVPEEPSTDDVLDIAQPEVDSSEEVEEDTSKEETTQSDASQESKPYIVLTEEERFQFAALIYHEARGSSFECQAACASVVLNRLTCGQKGYAGATNYGSLEGVIYAKNQFSPAHLIPNTKPNQMQYDVVDYVCQNGPTIPEYVCYFRADHYHNWNTNKYKPYCKIDTTYFSYKISVYESWLADQEAQSQAQ